MTEDLIYKIEVISLNDDVNWNKMDDIFKDYREVIDAIDYFLLHLTINHKLPGNVYNKLTGIGDNIRKERNFTQKQARYVVLALASYWSEIDLFKEMI